MVVEETYFEQRVCSKMFEVVVVAVGRHFKF